MPVPHPLFDPDYYLANNSDVATAGVDPFIHFLQHGAFEGRKPNPYFDPKYYLERYPDIAAAKTNPLVHYLLYGAAEGRNPSIDFDTNWYLEQNPDVRASGVNPLIHYLSHGEAEGRRPHHSQSATSAVSVETSLRHLGNTDDHSPISMTTSGEAVEFEFTIENHLSDDQDGVLISTGNDPILYLYPKHPRFPQGWVLIQIETDLLEGSSLAPSIYIDSGAGFNEGERIRLAPPIGGHIQQVAYFPQTVVALRYDPAEGPCKFHLGKICVEEIDGFDAAVRLLGLLYESAASNGSDIQELLAGGGDIYRRRGVAGLKTWLVDKATAEQQATQYTRWAAQCDTLSVADLQRFKEAAAALTYRPKFSIVMPTYNTPEQWLRNAIESVLNQVYPEWELCICDDCSKMSYVRQILESYRQADSRIKVVYRNENGHISRATNDAMDLIAGDFMCLMDHDDEIPRHALFEFAKILNEDRTVDFIYSDEDKISINGVRYDPFFKPDWSPEFLESCMYTAHFACYDMKIVKEVGAFRPECDGAQDYDFVLRYAEHVKNVRHVPKVLYHWRAIPGSTALAMDSKDYVIAAAVRALEGRMRRTRTGGKIIRHKFKGAYEFRADVVGAPLISIVIPTAGRDSQVRGRATDLLHNCISSIVEKSTYLNFEIIVVDNSDLRLSTISALSEYDIKYVNYQSGEFNVATKMNLGAELASGEYFLFLNDDTEVIATDWLESMISVAQSPGVGVVGAKLLFEDGRLQHVGVTFCEGLPDHIRRGFPRDDPGYFFSTVGTKNYLAVTGACMLISAGLFREVGGFDSNFAVNYNDIDLCLRVIKQGRRVVYCPLAELYHFESKNRERSVASDEIALFLDRWSEHLERDPYYGENLTVKPPTYELSFDMSRRLGS